MRIMYFILFMAFSVSAQEGEFLQKKAELTQEYHELLRMNYEKVDHQLLATFSQEEFVEIRKLYASDKLDEAQKKELEFLAKSILLVKKNN